MPNFVPCRTASDDQVHLYAPDDPTKALCERSSGGSSPGHADSEICPDCAKRLMRRILRLGGPQGISSIEVTVTQA